MITCQYISAEQRDDGKIYGGEFFDILVPTNVFEGMFLRDHLLTTLEAEFNIINNTRGIITKNGLDRTKTKREKRFLEICNCLWYDDQGRFYFDPNKIFVYKPELTSFFITVCTEQVSIEQEIDEFDVDTDDLDDNDHNDEDNSYDYFFDVYTQDKGVMLYDLQSTLINMLNVVKVK